MREKPHAAPTTAQEDARTGEQETPGEDELHGTRRLCVVARAATSSGVGSPCPSQRDQRISARSTAPRSCWNSNGFMITSFAPRAAAWRRSSSFGTALPPDMATTRTSG